LEVYQFSIASLYQFIVAL